MEFGLKTRCLDGTLNKRKFSIHIGERDEHSSPCLIYLDQCLSCFSAGWDGEMFNRDRMNEQVVLGVFLFY